MARSTVHDALKRASAAKLSWPLGDELTDEVLEARLFARIGVAHMGIGVDAPSARAHDCAGRRHRT